MQSSSARKSASLPCNLEAINGATIQARTAIGTAAAAQIARIARREYWGMTTLESMPWTGSVDGDGTVIVVMASILSGESMVLNVMRARCACTLMSR